MNKNVNAKGNIFLRFAVIAFCVYLIVVCVQLAFQIRDKRQELNSVNNKIAVEKERETELKRYMTAGSEDEFIEQIARENLGFAHPDEHIYYNIGG